MKINYRDKHRNLPILRNQELFTIALFDCIYRLGNQK